MSILRGSQVALRYLLGAVAGCAAPLWCRAVGHGPTWVPPDQRYPYKPMCLRCKEFV